MSDNKFFNIKLKELIPECYENIGINREQLTPQKILSAKTAINTLFLEWSNKATNLWSLDKHYINLEAGKSQYELPQEFYNISEINYRNYSRFGQNIYLDAQGELKDTNVYEPEEVRKLFVSDNREAVEVEAVTINFNGLNDEPEKISPISVGIKSDIDVQYDLTISGSNDGENYKPILVLEKSEFIQNQTKWFSLNNLVHYSKWRISSDDQEQVLNLNQLYFIHNIEDIPLAAVSTEDYFSLSYKDDSGRPSLFAFQNGRSKTINIYPTPGEIEQDKLLVCLYEKHISTIEAISDDFYMPISFYPPLVSGLCFKLATKFNPSRKEEFKYEYEELFDQANNTTGNLTLNITANYYDY